MLGLVIAIFIGYIGYRAPRIVRAHLAYMAIGAAIAVIIQTFVLVENRGIMGEDTSELWTALSLLPRWLATFALWLVIYLVAHAIGRWRRRRRP